jgi:hypothetical protein
MSLRHKRARRRRHVKLGSRAAVLDTMFAPPICRRRRRNDASRTELAVPTSSFRRIRRRRRLAGEHRSERSEQSNTARSAHDVRAADLQEEPTKRRTANGTGRCETVVSLDPMKTAASWRTSQRAERAIERSELVKRGNST